MEVGVSDQGGATLLKEGTLESLNLFRIFDELIDVYMSAQGEALDLRVESPAFFY